MIHQAKRKHFREAIQEAAEGEGIWRLAKRGRENQGAIVIPVMPPLQTDNGIARTIPEKAEALKARF